MPQIDENKYDERGYKISNTVTYAKTKIETAILSTIIRTAAADIRITTTGISIPVNVSGFNLGANVRGFTLGLDLGYFSQQDRRFWTRYLYNDINDNFIFNKIANNTIENTYSNIFRKNTINVRSVSSTYNVLLSKPPVHSFHTFERVPSLRNHVEVNVCQSSMFNFTKSQGLEFHYKEMANNESWIQGYGADKMTKGEFLSARKELPDILKLELTDHIKDFDKLTDKDIINPAPNDSLKPHFPGSWKSGQGETHWVNFPTEDELTTYFGKEKADLLMNSGEYDYNKKFIEALGEKDTCIVDQVNQAIPGVGDPIQVATPLAPNPKDLAYNNKHGGLVSIQLNRGKQQRYIFSQATGRTWIIGSNHLYYSGPRRVVHLDEHAELAETYKLMVKSSANYHFACRKNLEKNVFADDKREGESSSVNYRYEGDFNMETVSVSMRAKGTTAGSLENYISGIHSNKEGMISVRADVVSLSSVATRKYAVNHSSEANRSSIELKEDGFTASGDVIKLSATNKFSASIGGKEKITIDETEVTIPKGTKFRASEVMLKGNTRCLGKVEFL